MGAFSNDAVLWPHPKGARSLAAGHVDKPARIIRLIEGQANVIIHNGTRGEGNLAPA